MRPRWRAGIHVLVAASALASCHHAGVGPSFGYAVGSGGSYGWEATASAAHAYSVLTPGYNKWSVGQVFLQSPDGKRTATEYVAWEPWYYAGLSLGLSSAADGPVAPVLGLWEGIGGAMTGCGPQGYGGTVAVGYRYVGFHHEFYVTPKVMYFGQKRFLCYQ